MAHSDGVAAERLRRLGDQLAAAEQHGLQQEATSVKYDSSQSDTVALPEKLSEDSEWRVHRCAPATGYTAALQHLST